MSWIAWCGLNASDTGVFSGLAGSELYVYISYVFFVQRSCETIAHVMMMAVESLLLY